MELVPGNTPSMKAVNADDPDDIDAGILRIILYIYISIGLA